MDHNFKKQLGQNFLKDIEAILDFVEAIDPQKDDRVLEIGPGAGALTEYIASNVEYMHLLEIDTDLIPVLEEKFGFLENIKIQNGDILKLNIPEFLDQYKINKIAGALPYNISKLIIALFCANPELKLEKCVFILQKEVAHDYAGIGKKGTFLNHLYSLFNDIYLVSDIERSNFHPAPIVDSSIIIFQPLPPEKLKIKAESTQSFIKFLRNTFLNPRKKLLKNLKNIYRETNWEKIFKDTHLDENTRVEELNTDQLLSLYHHFRATQA